MVRIARRKTLAPGQWTVCKTLHEALKEVVAEWDAENERKDTGGIALARTALERADAEGLRKGC